MNILRPQIFLLSASCMLAHGLGTENRLYSISVTEFSLTLCYFERYTVFSSQGSICFVSTFDTDYDISITKCTFNKCSATDSGGALYIRIIPSGGKFFFSKSCGVECSSSDIYHLMYSYAQNFHTYEYVTIVNGNPSNINKPITFYLGAGPLILEHSNISKCNAKESQGFYIASGINANIRYNTYSQLTCSGPYAVYFFGFSSPVSM